MFVGARLKLLRKINKMTQEELGSKLGITKVSVCCYENNVRTPSLEVLYEMSNIFGVSSDYLLGKDIPIVMESALEYDSVISKEELKFLKQLRMYPELHKKLMEDPKRMLDLIEMRIK